MAATNTAPPDILEATIRRNDCLQFIIDGPQKKSALAHELDISWSTVDRATSNLETAGLVEPCDDGYQATATGKQIAASFFDLVDTLDESYQSGGQREEQTPAQVVLETVIKRIKFLETLYEKPKDKPALAEELGMSRSTVDRGIRELETAGLTRYTNGEFTLTTIGEITVSGLFDLIGTIEQRQRLNPFLKWVPDGTFDIDIDLVSDADLLVAEPGDPWSMINRHVELVKTMDDLRALLPFTGLHAHEAGHKQVVEHGAGGELVVEPKIIDIHMSEPKYADLSEEIIATGRFDYFEYPEQLPYALAIIKNTVQIVVSEGDEPRALLESDSPEVKNWAEEKYDEYKQQSEKIT
jgi:predicted transcriptional regulator